MALVTRADRDHTTVYGGNRKAKSVILYYTRFIQEQSKGSCAITSIAALSTLDSAKYIN